MHAHKGMKGKAMVCVRAGYLHAFIIGSLHVCPIWVWQRHVHDVCMCYVYAYV